MKRRPPSIRRQLTVRILAGTLVLLAAAGSVFLAVIHRQLVHDFDRMLDSGLEDMKRNTERKGGVILCDMPETFSLGSQQKSAAPEYCQLFLEDGTVVAVSQTLGTNDLPRLAGRDEGVSNVRLPDGSRGRIMQKTFLPKVDPLETQTLPEDPNEQTFAIPEEMDPAAVRVVMVLGHSREGLDALLRSLYIAGGVVAVLLAIALAWLVRFSITRALSPVREMNAQISAIAPGTLDRRLHLPKPPEELASIETTVNGLLHRLERAFERERRFSDDLAHELRTPIAELLAACEVGARWPDDVDSAQQFFRDGQAIALQLEKIVGALLTLSRCEGGNTVPHKRRIALQPLVRDCWRRAASGAAEKGTGFHERVSPDLTVETDGDMLEIILGNLLENAVAHGGPGGVVECDSEGTRLRVANAAGDLRTEDLERVFDRFWRKDESRTDRNHIGLGLPIARALCEMLGLRLVVGLTPMRMFEVSIDFSEATPAT